MQRNKKIFLVIVVVLGMVFPFNNHLVVIEMFFLLIPFGLLIIGSLIYLIISLLGKRNKRWSIFIFSIIPIFLLSQVISIFTVDKIQKLRSERIISEIEYIKLKTGYFPENFDISGGIEYKLMEDKEGYSLEHSRGFFDIERYCSYSNDWRSFGFDL